MNLFYLLNNKKNVFQILIFILILIIIFFIYFNYSTFNSNNFIQNYIQNFIQHTKIINVIEPATALPDKLKKAKEENSYSMQQKLLYGDKFESSKQNIQDKINESNKKNKKISLYDFLTQYKTDIKDIHSNYYQTLVYSFANDIDPSNNSNITNNRQIDNLFQKHLTNDTTITQTFNTFRSNIITFLPYIIHIYISIKIYDKIDDNTFLTNLDTLYNQFIQTNVFSESNEFPEIIGQSSDFTLNNHGYTTNHNTRSVIELGDGSSGLIQEQEKKIMNIQYSSTEKINFQTFLNTSSVKNDLLYLAVLHLERFYSLHAVKNFEEFYTTKIYNNNNTPKISNENIFKYIFLSGLGMISFNNDKTYDNTYKFLIGDNYLILLSFVHFFNKKAPINFYQALNQYENL